MEKKRLTDERKVSSFFKNHKLIYGFIIGVMCASFALLIVAGILTGSFTSIEKFQSYIEASGIFAPIVFVIFDILSVAILIIPCSIFYGLGSAMFGAGLSTILNCASSAAGSFLIFALMKRWGRPLLETMASNEKIEKYNKHFKNPRKFEVFFAVMLLLPFTPDNLLCYIAGTLDISWRRYITIILAFKLWKIAVFCFGSETLIEFFVHGLL